MTVADMRFLQSVPSSLHEIAVQAKRIANALEERNRLMMKEKTMVTQAPEIVQTPRFSETAYAQ